MSTAVTTDTLLTITQEVFAALVDGEPGLLSEGQPAPTTVHAWVDITGPAPARVAIATTADVADELTHSLLAERPETPVHPEDIEDALGELANVVGGNVKALLPGPSALTLPRTGNLPDPPGGDAVHVPLTWRGQHVAVTAWFKEGER